MDDVTPLYPGSSHVEMSSNKTPEHLHSNTHAPITMNIPGEQPNVMHSQPIMVNLTAEQPNVIRSQPVLMSNMALVGPENAHITCPFCYASVKSSIKHTVTTRTHVLALRCCLLMCCCLPYCLNSAQNTDHYCPSCNRFLGTYKR